MEVAVTGEHRGYCDVAASTSWKALDCSEFKGEYLRIWANADMWYCFCSTSGATPDIDAAGTLTQFADNVADQLPAGNAGHHRLVASGLPFLLYRTVTGAAEIRVKPASRDGKLRSPHL